MIRKLLAALMALIVMLCGFAAAEETVPHAPIAILYTNDVHCGIDDNIGYAGLVAYKKAYEKAGYEVMLVDDGDAIQGDAIGTISTGEYIIDIMNEVGYSVATIGNHEFDYSIDRLMELIDKANFEYVCCNFIDEAGNAVLPAYTIQEIGGYKVAFVGIATPETFVKSTPTYFQNEAGEFIYSFCGGNDGQDLYDAVQKAVDDAKTEGAEIVIALAHLGIDASSQPWTSSDVIVNTSGIDVVIDGHSHSVVEEERVLNKNGEEVLLTSTGTKLANVGVLTITEDEEGNPAFATSLHSESIFQDEEMTAFVDSIKAQYEDTLNQVVAHTNYELTIYDPTAVDEEGNQIRIIRSQETNLGDLCADAYRYVSGADVAIVNGGGIRTSISEGDITYGQIIKVHPFGNAMTTMEATGQQILDCLEMSVRKLPGENGGFMQVSGLTFEVNMSIESTVVTDENGMFVEVSGARRVENAMIQGEAIDPEKTYTIASTNYILKSAGDGVNMFTENTILQDEVMLDNQVLINYITEALGGEVTEMYADPYGEGRIVIHE